MNEEEIKDFAITQADFRLSPDVPKEQRENFVQFLMMFGKITALSNIQREDVLGYLFVFDTIAMAYDDGYYDYANEMQGQFITKLQLCRSIDGFETKWSSGGLTQSKHVEEMLEGTRKKTFGKKWFGLKKDKTKAMDVNQE